MLVISFFSFLEKKNCSFLHVVFVAKNVCQKSKKTTDKN